jgi:hypothetical protein
MSRRTWTTLDGWDVVVGWDPPMGRYFMDISRDCEHDDDEDREGVECKLCQGSGQQFKYDCLDDDEPNNVDIMGGIYDLRYVELILNRYLTDWPREVLIDVYTDQDQDLANVIKYYGGIGYLKEQEG